MTFLLKETPLTEPANDVSEVRVKKRRKTKTSPLHLIRWRIITAFAAVLIVLIAMLSLTYSNMESLKKELIYFNDETLQTQVNVNELSALLSQMTSLQKTYVITGSESDLQKFDDKRMQFEKHLTTLQKTFKGSKDFTIYLEKIVSYYTTYANTANKIANQRKVSGFEAAQQTIALGAGEKAIDNVNQQINYTTDILNKKSSEKLHNLEKSTTIAELLFFSLTIIAIICLTLAGFFLFRSIKRNTKRIQQTIDMMASDGGDLTKRLEMTSADEFAQIGKSTNALIDSVVDLVSQINTLSQNVSDSGAQLKQSASQSSTIIRSIAASSTTISTSSENTITHMNEAAKKMEHLHQETTQLSNDTEEMKRCAEKMILTAKNGYESVQEAADRMMDIEETIANTTQTVQSLKESSTQITSIIGSITDIADQTNLLALNASIEAARAGEAGKGFAVVADEVRKLAFSSQKAANEVTAMITEIQTEIQTIIAQNQEGVDSVIRGVQTTNDTTSSLDAIIEQSSQTLQTVDMMYDKIATLETYSQDVTHAFIEVNMIAEENAIQAEENAHATEQGIQTVESIFEAIDDLSQQANELQQRVGAFKVS